MEFIRKNGRPRSHFAAWPFSWASSGFSPHRARFYVVGYGRGSRAKTHDDALYPPAAAAKDLIRDINGSQCRALAVLPRAATLRNVGFTLEEKAGLKEFAPGLK